MDLYRNFPSIENRTKGARIAEEVVCAMLLVGCIETVQHFRVVDRDAPKRLMIAAVRRVGVPCAYIHIVNARINCIRMC